MRCSASAMYANYNICNFEAMLRRGIYGFMQRIEASNNTIVQTILQSWTMRFKIWDHWIKALYT